MGLSVRAPTTHGNLLARDPRPRRARRSCSARTSTPSRSSGADRAGRSSTAAGRTRTTRSSAPTTRRPSPSSSRSRGASASRARRSALELLFTVCGGGRAARRQGVRRAACCDADFGYVFDHATADRRGHRRLARPTTGSSAEFRGRAAHAGIRPEDGRSAILAAAHARSPRCRTGGSTTQTTANVGSIQGGVGSTNVVPERCRSSPRPARSTPSASRRSIAAMIDASTTPPPRPSATSTSSASSCSRATARSRSAPAIVAAEAALRACGYEPEPGSSPAAARTPTRSTRNGIDVRQPGQRHRAQPRADRARVASRRSRACSTCASPCSTRRPRCRDAPMSFEVRARGRAHRVRGRDRRRHGGPLPPRGRRGGHAPVGRPPRRGGDGRARRRARLARPPAARGDRRSPTCSSCPAGKLDEEGETPLRVRAARARRGDRQGRRALGARSRRSSPRPGSPTSGATSSSPRG